MNNNNFSNNNHFDTLPLKNKFDVTSNLDFYDIYCVMSKL